MRLRLVLSAILIFATSSLAQQNTADHLEEVIVEASHSDVAPPVVIDHAPPCEPMCNFCCEPNDCPSPIWVSAEYLIWWMKKGGNPNVLVTQGDLSDGPLAGALGLPNTRILFGGTDLDYTRRISDEFSGGRAMVGSWLDCDHTVGIELGGFFLEQRGLDYRTRSDANGDRLLSVPYFDIDPLLATGERRFLASAPNFFAGGINVASTSHLWGTEANAIWNVRRDCRLSFDLVGGFRHLDLDEGLHLRLAISDIQNGTYTFRRDRFDTDNEFFGGHIGCRAKLHYERFDVSLAARVSLGQNNQIIRISGLTNNTMPDVLATPIGISQEGIFARSSNSGRFVRRQFAAIPEVQIQVAYPFTTCLQGFVGYDFLFWTDVVRPGEQVDRVLNITQNPAAASRPTVPFQESDFWAQGVSFGLRFGW